MARGVATSGDSLAESAWRWRSPPTRRMCGTRVLSFPPGTTEARPAKRQARRLFPGLALLVGLGDEAGGPPRPASWRRTRSVSPSWSRSGLHVTLQCLDPVQAVARHVKRAEVERPTISA